MLGAARDLIMLHIFGAGAIMDAFLMAMTIPNVFRRLTAEGSLTMAFIPLYVDIKHNRSIAAAKLFTQKIMCLLLLVTSMIVGLGMLFSQELVYLFASGFASQPEKFVLTVELTQIMFPYLLFISLTALAMGVLNSEQKFASPAAAPILLNLCMIAMAVVFSSNFEQPIYAVAWGVVIGGVCQLVLQIPFLFQLDQSLAPKSFLNDPDVQRLLKIMLPTLFGVAVYQVNIVVLRSIGSTLPDGQLTYYNIASRLQELVVGVLAFSFAMASLPEFSRQTSDQAWDKAFRTLADTLSSALFFLLPATAGLVAFALPIISMLYLHGQFTWHDVQASAPALQLIALGIPALAFIRILISIFFALKDTRSPVLASTFSVLVTASCGWYLSEQYQVVGLVLALVLGLWAQVLILVLMLARKSLATTQWFPLKQVLLYSSLSLLIGGLVSIAVPLTDWQQGAFTLQNWTMFISVIVGACLLYILMLAALKDKQAKEIVGFVLRRF
jgi:putative peptidoglycan lipid II flippase